MQHSNDAPRPLGTASSQSTSNADSEEIPAANQASLRHKDTTRPRTKKAADPMNWSNLKKGKSSSCNVLLLGTPAILCWAARATTNATTGSDETEDAQPFKYSESQQTIDKHKKNDEILRLIHRPFK